MMRYRICLQMLVLPGYLILSGCVPVEPSEEELVGSWQVESRCGIENLELKLDRSYFQEIEYSDGGRVTHTGRIWEVTPKDTSLDSGHIVLHDAMEFCSPFYDTKLAKPEKTERQLATIWEWGRLTLQFHPDLPGFTRR